MAFDITATALALFHAHLFIDITRLIQAQMKVYHSSLGRFQKMMFFSLRMSLVLNGKKLAWC